jgi:succinate-semialdehyde dehydrogenase/glutarate-semialdehyde dehydrogenase
MKLKNKNLFTQKCFINGKWVDKKEKIMVFNPSNENLIGVVPSLDETDVIKAVDAAEKAMPKWAKLTGKERSKILRDWHDLIIKNQDDLAVIITTEQGKPIEEARSEIIYGASFIEWFAEEAKRILGDVILAPKSDQKIITTLEPIGIVAAITPWNFPSAMITRKAAAALAAGCAVILKPSELTPFSALALAVLAREAGIPDGIFNVLTGDSQIIGAEFCENKKIRKLSFTGSTKIGKLISKQSAEDLKHMSLELGGNAPFIVFADADLDKAVEGLIHGKFRNAGQACTCVNRILVDEKIYKKFLDKFLVEAKKLKVGDGFDKSSKLGPLISSAALDKVERLVANAIKLGAKCEIGGKKLKGTFYPVTVLSNATHEMDLAKEEIFGPVAAFYKFKTEEEAIELSNSTIYGLGSYLYTNDNGKIWRVSSALKFGMVAINSSSFATEVAPFGGIKHSGYGREGSHLGIEEFCQVKALHLSY